MLRNRFYTLYQKFTKNNEFIGLLWKEIETSYSKENRHYHTLSHLEAIYKALESFPLTPLMEFSIFYHDIIYNIEEKDNEEQSSLVAKRVLTELNTPNKLIEEVSLLIMETKRHNSTLKENQLFLDADLAILGSSKENYIKYTQQIREEYHIYNNYNYNKGRKALLKSFLEKDSIYLSNFFYQKYEKQAKENILKEYNSLLI
jgi:predicted metal-dependent HD superfamily phosphohydrolase